MSAYRLPLDAPTIGDVLLSRTHELKLHLIRFADDDGDRNVMADFTISGTLRPDGSRPGDERLIKSLLREFLMGQPPATEGGECHE